MLAFALAALRGACRRLPTSRSSPPSWPDQEPGWLAREIATHDDRAARDADAPDWDVARPIADQPAVVEFDVLVGEEPDLGVEVEIEIEVADQPAAGDCPAVPLLDSNDKVIGSAVPRMDGTATAVITDPDARAKVCAEPDRAAAVSVGYAVAGDSWAPADARIVGGES